MKIFIFSIINYIAGFHLLPEFTDVEEINTLKTHWTDKNGRSIPWMALEPEKDGHFANTYTIHIWSSTFKSTENNILIALSELN